MAERSLEHDYRGEYRPIIIHHPERGEIVSIPQEVKFYLVRLADLTDLLKNIDRGILENWYSANAQRGIPDVTDAVSLAPYLHEKGMRWGVLKSLSGTRNILANLGYQKEADRFIYDSVKNQAEGQQEGKQ